MDKHKAKKIRQALRKGNWVPVEVEGEKLWKRRGGKARDAKPLSKAHAKMQIEVAKINSAIRNGFC